MPISDLILDDLAAAPGEFERLLRALPPETWDFKPADWAECPGERFSVRENLCHLRDIEVEGYQRRFARTRVEQDPDLPSVDGYALAEERRYGETDPHAALAAFRAARAESLALIRGFSEAELARPARFNEYGPTNLAGLVYYLSSHDRQHVACFHWLMGKAAFECASIARARPNDQPGTAGQDRAPGMGQCR